MRSADDIDEEDEKTRCTRVYALLQRMLSMREEGGGGGVVVWKAEGRRQENVKH